MKKTVTNDRSAPVTGGKSNSNNDMNANNRSPGPKNGNNDGGGGGTGGGGQARLPGIGGLFGEGFPTLKPAGTNRVPGKQISIR